MASIFRQALVQHSHQIKALMLVCCCLLSAAVSQAQQPAASPILLVYVVDFNEGLVMAPLIAVGVISPTISISAVEKCVTISDRNPNIHGIAVQLKPADAKLLSAAMEEKADNNSNQPARKLIWFATPDNKVLEAVEANYIARKGVLAFYQGQQEPTFNYLTEMLKPK